MDGWMDGGLHEKINEGGREYGMWKRKTRAARQGMA
jgi:hypothetical protein